MLSGILNVDKPKGLTSHDVVDLIRKAARQRKVGHAGTLDPIATGVLPLCLGNATKLSEFLTAEEKEYSLVCRFGLVTDTQDITGEILKETPVRDSLELERIEQVLENFRGPITQTPPMVSAKRHQGKRLYDLARQGIEVEREPIEVTIQELEVLGFEPPDLRLRVRCSKGTYVRTLCHDIGAALGCGAAMAGLVRTRCGTLSVEDSVAVTDLKDPDSVRLNLLSPDEALKKYPAVTIRDSEVNLWMTGRSIRGGAILAASADYERDALLRVKARDGRLVGLAKSLFNSGQVGKLGGDLEVLKPVRVFPQPFSSQV
ncbi:MAG: tRNA pseudouridine(55) synthase TruB [Candidatus Omnitrophica bacterium]|nr:tRNA pseudouridine synthase B [bacterium]NUN97429.1 tRNA pseudouridine(55) synthase TruB [Candidatus Omnitrophota bacterium]